MTGRFSDGPASNQDQLGKYRDAATDSATGRVLPVLEQYLTRLEQGVPPHRDELIAAHPELADALRDCLDSLEFLHRAAAAPQVPAGRAAPAPTTALGALRDYSVIREIGRGGMGVVYEAEQVSLGRTVALKVLPFAAVLDPKQLQRFKNEAQTAARLEHPNIVPVYAVGVERGVHYYAMQYVDGQTVAELIEELRHIRQVEDDSAKQGESAKARVQSDANESTEENRRSKPTTETATLATFSTEYASNRPAYFRAVAQLGVQAADALAYAHELGIVHRDIKPSNLLLDRRGKLWVVDFGLARLPNSPALTMSGDVLGTLRYMSPEQATGRGSLVDHRSDVYSLGATLYELLTLQPAHPADDRQLLSRQITEREAPPVRRFDVRIPRELETIVLKALAKERDYRYATARELADDLGRFLDRKPIQAKAPGMGQRVRVWCRRHPAWVTAAMVFCALGALGLLASGGLVLREQQRTARALAETQATLDFLVNDLLLSASPEQTQGRTVTVDEVLANAERRIERAFAEQPLVEASVRRTLGEVYRKLGRYGQAEQQFVSALGLSRGMLGEEHPDTLRTRNNLANALMKRGKLTEARAEAEQALRLRRQVLGNEHRETLQSMFTVATVRYEEGDYVTAEKMLEDTLTLQRRILGAEHRDTLATINNLANLHLMQERFQEARVLYDAALKIKRRVLGETNPATILEMNNLAVVFHRSHDYEAARKLYEAVVDLRRKVLKKDHPLTLSSMHNLARLLQETGKLNDARELLDETIRLRQQVLGTDDRETLSSMNDQANVLLGLGKMAEASRLQRQVLDARKRTLDEEHPDTLISMHNLARALAAEGKLDQAAELNLRTLEIRRRVLGPDDRETLSSMNSAAGLLHRQGKLHDALELFQQTWEARCRVLGEEDPATLSAQHNVATVLVDLGEIDKSLELHRKVLALRRSILGDSHPRTLSSMSSIVGILIKQEEHLDEAKRLVQQIVETRKQDLGVEHPKTLHAASKLALVLGKQGNFNEAGQTCLDALQLATQHWATPGQDVKQRSLIRVAHYGNEVARLLAGRDDVLALRIAEEVVVLVPESGAAWNTLGVYAYHGGNWRQSIQAMTKSMQLRSGGDARDWFLVAMAHWQLNQKDEAHSFYDRAVQWTETHAPGDEQLIQLRAQAERLIEDE